MLMRFSTIAIAAALGSLAVAQDILGSLPQCGRDCFGNNFANCEQFDIGCICGNENLITELSCCVSTTCDSNDQNAIITLASGLCKAYGVDVPTQASCASSASSTATSASSTATSASSAGSSSTSSSEESTTAASTTAAPTTTASESAAAASQSSSGTPGAAGPIVTAGPGLGLAVGMAGLLAVL